MGHRLSRITTRTGDDGTTGLGDGSRVPKTHARIAALGDVDELNSFVGVLLTAEMPESVRALMLEVQQDLFDLGGELAVPGWQALTDAHLARLDEAIAGWNADLPPLKEFILPGGSSAAAHAHVVRAVCRRAERSVVALAETGTPPSLAARYLNRLSDLMFILCRALNRAAGVPDVLWQPDRNKGQADA